MKTHKRFFLIVVLAFTSTVGILGIGFFSLTALIHHWHLMYAPCVECIKTFATHVFSIHHLGPLSAFLFSTYAFICGIIFFFREWKVHTKLSRPHSLKKSVQFVEEGKIAAWSSGILFPQIQIHKKFWKKLNQIEKKALKAHEKCHIVEHHTLQMLLLGWTQAILPIPIISQWMKNFIENVRLQNEYQADFNAISITSKQTLISLLYKALKFESLPQRYSGAGVDSLLTKRVEYLTSRKEVSTSSLTYEITQIIFASTFLIVGVTLFISAIEPLQNCL